jgi:hypothetical protein
LWKEEGKINKIAYEKRDFADIINVKTLRWGVYPGLSK